MHARLFCFACVLCPVSEELSGNKNHLIPHGHQTGDQEQDMYACSVVFRVVCVLVFLCARCAFA